MASAMLLALLLLLPQQPASPAPRPADSLGPAIDDRGWPVVENPPAFGIETAPASPRRLLDAPHANASAPVVTVSPAFETAFSTIGTPRAFRSLGGISAWWRITVHGPQGETIAIREVTHLCDPSVPDRDRLEFADGRVVGRHGPTVFAERHGLPWPTLLDAATHELALFGLHLRLCWWLADRNAYVEVGSEVVGTGPDSLTRIQLMPRQLRAEVGPESSPTVADRFELLFPLVGGPPRELRHEFAASRQHRRVRLEDWRPVGEVSMPFRRTYVDPDGKPTTTLELLRVEPRQEVADRDFRLH